MLTRTCDVQHTMALKWLTFISLLVLAFGLPKEEFSESLRCYICDGEECNDISKAETYVCGVPIPTEPPTQPPTDPPTQQPTDPPTQPPTDPPTEPPTDPPTEPPTDPPTQPPTDPPTEPPTDPPTEPPTDPPTEPPTDPPTQPPIDPPTETPTDPPTQPPIDPLTQPPIDPPTEPPTDPPTQPPIDPPAEPPTDPPTQPPIDPPTEPPTDPTQSPIESLTDAPVQPPVEPEMKIPIIKSSDSNPEVLLLPNSKNHWSYRRLLQTTLNWKCVKVMYTDDDVLKTKRGCYDGVDKQDVAICQKFLDDGDKTIKGCRVCNVDGCNPASTAKYSWTLLTLILLLPILSRVL